MRQEMLPSVVSDDREFIIKYLSVRKRQGIQVFNECAGVVVCLTATSTAVAASNGGRPVIAWNNVAPSE